MKRKTKTKAEKQIKGKNNREEIIVSDKKRKINVQPLCLSGVELGFQIQEKETRERQTTKKDKRQRRRDYSRGHEETQKDECVAHVSLQVRIWFSETGKRDKRKRDKKEKTKNNR